MIEFFLSKFWAVICGLILLGAAIGSIDGLTDASESASQEAVFKDLVSEINAFSRIDGASSMILALSDVIFDDESWITFRNGSAWLYRTDGNTALYLNEGIVVMGEVGLPMGNGSIDAHRADIILLTKEAQQGTCTLTVQEANVSTTFFTDSMNVSQSFSSL